MLGEKKRDSTLLLLDSTHKTRQIYDDLWQLERKFFPSFFCGNSPTRQKSASTQKTYKISCWFRNMESFWAPKLERHVRKARRIWRGLWVGIGIFDFSHTTCRWNSIKKRRSRWRVIESVRSDSIIPDIGRYPSKCRDILQKFSNVTAITWRKC